MFQAVAHDLARFVFLFADTFTWFAIPPDIILDILIVDIL